MKSGIARAAGVAPLSRGVHSDGTRHIPELNAPIFTALPERVGAPAGLERLCGGARLRRAPEVASLPLLE
jgi:hypothetical protein